MTDFNKAVILDLLKMPYPEFEAEFLTAACKTKKEAGKGDITATAMLGFDNICRCSCLYCGMRAPNSTVPRYRMSPEEIYASACEAKAAGFTRIFLISGEDPKYGFDRLTDTVSKLKRLGFHISLALGEMTEAQYSELHTAGADEYVLKFETSDRELFNRLKPSTNYRKRLDCMDSIRKTGMKLASGNIIGLPGSNDGIIADDILLCREYGISWAPVIPYLPAANTPLAVGAQRGSLETLYREIAILRLMLPELNITAQQPGKDVKCGLAGMEGNLAAIRAGANMLFAEMLPQNKVQAFNVVDDRLTKGLSHIKEVAKAAGEGIVM